MSAVQRLRGLARKEIKQILRDPSAILIAFLLPIVLMLVNGFGISFDARQVSLAVVATAPDSGYGLTAANCIFFGVACANAGARPVAKMPARPLADRNSERRAEIMRIDSFP